MKQLLRFVLLFSMIVSNLVITVSANEEDSQEDPSLNWSMSINAGFTGIMLDDPDNRLGKVDEENEMGFYVHSFSHAGHHRGSFISVGGFNKFTGRNTQIIETDGEPLELSWNTALRLRFFTIEICYYRKGVITPYVHAGIGGYWGTENRKYVKEYQISDDTTGYSLENLENSWKRTGVTCGAGLNVNVTKTVFIDISGSYHYIFKGGWKSMYVASLGLGYRF